MNPRLRPAPAPPAIVKICGLSTPQTVAAALEAGADMVGFVFFPRSPRHVALDQAAALAGPVRNRAAIVALTVDADDDALDAIMNTLAPDWLQLHGKESPARVEAVRARTGRPVMKALGVASRDEAMDAGRGYGPVADRLLFDAKPPPDAALPGGNGITFDWRVLAGLDLPIPFMLSGGLTVANVGAALAVPDCVGVDVSSGVETAPGLKDIGLIADFVAAARRASHGASPENAHG